MSDEKKIDYIEEGAKEGLLRLGLTDSMTNVDSPIEHYENAYRKHITYRIPVTEDYLPYEGFIKLSGDEYSFVEDTSELFEGGDSESTRQILVYDGERMVMPQIVEVEREESEDDEDDDEYEYTFTLHMAHQDSMWYLRNRLVSSQRLLLLFDVLILLVVSGSYYWYSNISTGTIFALGLLLLSTVTLLHLIILTILSFRL